MPPRCSHSPSAAHLQLGVFIGLVVVGMLESDSSNAEKAGQLGRSYPSFGIWVAQISCRGCAWVLETLASVRTLVVLSTGRLFGEA